MRRLGCLPFAVYPRVCGGTASSIGVLASCQGLSPRVRGNRHRRQRNDLQRRSIPACAGEPYPAYGRPQPVQVYPRVCGGTHQVNGRGGAHQGLSPRVRGNRYNHQVPCARKGSIPACAGEPRNVKVCVPVVPVYPRVCGGTRPAFPFPFPFPGLSPRVRGNPSRPSGIISRQWSIPACAGEPDCDGGDDGDAGVYPRVCGGTVRRAWRRCCRIGLSPRVRGNPDWRMSSGFRRRSIPACAGEPPSGGGAGRPRMVYPRVCGGTLLGQLIVVRVTGLSPRVRGNQQRVAHVAGGDRSIPACAGEPLPQHPEGKRVRVYPRVCGGTAHWGIRWCMG